MSVEFLPNGLGESGTDVLATAKPLQVSGSVWWVNSSTGVDAASPAGKDREKPLATLAQAVTNAADGDIIVLMQGHTETRTAFLNIGVAVTIVGIGTTSGKPSVQLKNNSAAGSLLTIGVAGISIRNVYFPTNVQSNNAARISVAADRFSLIGCYFECGANDQAAAVQIGNGFQAHTFRETTVISTATSVATRPAYGIRFAGTSADVLVEGIVLSDGTVGFTNYAFDASAGVVSRFRGLSVSLLLGAAMHMGSATGWLNVQTSTGGAGVIW